MATAIDNARSTTDPAPDSKAPPTPHRQIRFVHNAGQPPPKRRRINAACLTCRKRKTRCDGDRPLCTTCTKNGHHCLGYPEEGKKRDDDKDSNQGSRMDSLVPEDDADDDDDDESRTDEVHNSIIVNTQVPDEMSPPDQLAVENRVSPGERQRPHQVGGKAASSSPTLVRLPARLPSQQPSVSVDAHADSESVDSRRNPSHRVPYFRYFGPTAIVPGYKQMVVSVQDRRRSGNGSQAGLSPVSTPSNLIAGPGSVAGSEVIIEDLPVYDPNDPAPVHPLITALCATFFRHVGCNYPFLKEAKFLGMVKEKNVEPILVDAICAIAARFADMQMLTGGSEKMPRVERGAIFAQRAKAATVDTFPCPSVGAVQALLLMAYEGFGADQDSALWMYLGLAIRMAIDLGLQKRIGIMYQGEKDPWYIRHRSVTNGESASPEEKRHSEGDRLTLEEQREVEQERIDTFWAVFVLDRVISSGTGRPVTFREDEIDLDFPKPQVDPATGWPAPMPIFLEIVHLYGRVCDILNKVRDMQELTQDKWDKLSKLENQLTKVYKRWDARLHFNVSNFRSYLSIGQGTTFILLHFWFHALFIILHQPTLMFPLGNSKDLQLLPDSRELSMSSAKTICDILAFADLINPKSFIGNPFTSQPMYIAACAFLMESSTNASRAPSREASPPVMASEIREQMMGASSAAGSATAGSSKHSRHSLLASAANQNYQRCYSSLQQLHTYWGGVKYILTALDQKSKGIWDCETYTSEEYEATKRPPSLAAQFSRFADAQSPKMAGPPIGWTLAGSANSPNSSLTLMYQTPNMGQYPGSHPRGMGREAVTPPGNMVYDPIRQNQPEGMYPPLHPHRGSSVPFVARSHPAMNMDEMREPSYTQPTPNSQGSYDTGYAASPSSSSFPPGSGQMTNMPSGANGGADVQAMYYMNGATHPVQASWGGGIGGNMDAIMFDSQDIDIGALGLQPPELMHGLLDYMPGDVLDAFDHQHQQQQQQQ